MFSRTLPLAAFAAIFCHAAAFAVAMGPDVRGDIDAAKNGLTRARVTAVGRLGRLQAEDVTKHKVVDVLLKDLAAVKGVNKRVRVAAIEAASGLVMRAVPDSKQAVMPVLMRILKDGAEELAVRKEAARSLGKLCDAEDVGDASTIRGLESIAGDKRGDVILRGILIEALGTIGHKGSYKVLREGLSEDNEDLRPYVARAWKNYLKRQPPEDLAAVKLLMKLAADKSNEVDIRVALLEAVGRAGKKGGLKTVSDQLVRILAEKDDPRIVGEAIKALALVKDPKAVTALAGAYRQYGDAGGAQTRALVCEALGEYYEKLAGMSLLGKQAAAKVTATLVAALNEDADAEVCSAAAFSLGNMDRRFDRTKAVASLIEALTDQSDKVRTSSLNSLKLMTDQDFGTDVERWRKWYRVNERSLRPRIR